MFENNKCISHAVGGAVVGVAVGMAIHRVLSPNSTKQSSPAIPEIQNSKPSICGKKRPRDLEIPKSSKENEFIHFRSKSPCGRSKVLQSRVSSSRVSSNSSSRSSVNPILIDFARYSNKNPDLFKIEKPFELTDELFESRDHSGFSLSSRTEYSPLNLQDKENSSPNPPASRRSNNKSFLGVESNKKSTHPQSSTDYQTNWGNLNLVKDAEDDEFESENNVTSSHRNMESAMATDGDTHEYRSKVCNFMYPRRTSLKSQEFRTLPIYNESTVNTSTEYMEN